MSTPIIKLVIYSSNGEQRQRLLEAIRQYTSKCLLETVADHRLLKTRLRENATNNLWLILVAANTFELGCFSAMEEFIHNRKCILILPDQHRETISSGHALYPRFISFTDYAFDDVASVLKRVIQKCESKCNQTY